MFVLPRAVTATGEKVEFNDVYREVAEVLRAHMGPGATFKVKKVTRSYAFELADVPRHPADYLKVRGACPRPTVKCYLLVCAFRIPGGILCALSPIA